MSKQFILYRTQLLFTGLTKEESLKVETVFSRYSVYYKDSVSMAVDLQHYDLLCVSDIDFQKNEKNILDSNIPFVVIGEKKVPGSIGVLLRSELILYWHDLIKEKFPAVKMPKIEGIEVGVIVRSKTIPIFGKGVITQLISADEVIVKFSTTKLLAKDTFIRCFKSQLQILSKETENEMN